jgi:ABC-type multidrug transport system ATPase subunit
MAAAKAALLGAWEMGSSGDVSAAMSAFISANEEALRNHKPEGVENRVWTSSVAKWLRNTDHISVAYGLQYAGVDVERLSPGTRGIVLLLLFLGIDEQDDRPLIIDQPEENLDPQSVFDELVGRFREARSRRQIIIVTHNANLVVNTDADQVIVANASPHGSGTLPNISYECGGLENSRIRRRVCEILEGGEKAFKERARRLRVSLG